VWRRVALAGGLLALGAADRLGAQEIHAWVGAELIPISGEPIPDAVLLVRQGRITALGSAADVAVPAGATLHDASGRVIMPGLVDTHSHVGGPAGADRAAPIQPEVRGLGAFDARGSGVQRARAGGITTLNVMPGSGHLMSGQTLYLKLRPATSIDELLIRGEDGRIAGGMKMANGTNPRRDPPFPGTRGKSAALVRAAFVGALEYRR
jgi:imidazolonepropionase-like amidohydrolase